MYLLFEIMHIHFWIQNVPIFFHVCIIIADIVPIMMVVFCSLRTMKLTWVNLNVHAVRELSDASILKVICGYLVNGTVRS